MNTSLLKGGAMKAVNLLQANSPTILTGLGVAGVITTVALAIKGTTKANNAIWCAEDQRVKDWVVETGEDQGSYPDDPILTLKEKAQLTWQYYVPTAIMGAATIACIVGANTISMQRTAVLAGAYKLAEESIREYKEKVVEALGEKKEAKIYDDVAQDRLDRKPISKEKVIVTGDGDHLCFDSLSSRYFLSNMEKIRKAEADFNRNLLTDAYLPLNDFYHELGLPGIELGRNVGWTMECKGLEIHYSSKLADDGRPCMVLTYGVTPRNL